MEAKWSFPSSNGGEKRGLNDSGIETFNDNPIKSLAREICQNSLDAVISGQRAIVEFNTFTLDKIDFPDVYGFTEILEKCLDYSKNNVNHKTPLFFETALTRINKDKIKMLRISDFNTTGLKGSDWNNLVNSSGSSEKEEGKGGSFGIGKNAPFACSEFRTVFYSTLDRDGNQKSKGVSKLISYKLDDNADGSENVSQGTGYYGVVTPYNINHLENMLNLDKSFSRTSSGTDIFVSALKIISEEEFKSNIIAEVLDGYLIAIWNGKLEIKVNGYIINKETLSNVIQEYKKSLNDHTVMCFELLIDNTTIWQKIPVYISNTLPLGDINFGFKLRYDGSNKVSMIRSSGMKILDKGGLCPSLRFVGMAIVEGDALNTFLRGLENPSHNKWEPQRSSDPSAARNLLKDMYNSLTDKLNEEASNAFDDQIDIEGAGDYLPDEIEDENNKNLDNVKKEESLNKIIDVEVKVIQKPRSVAHLETDEIGDDIETAIEAEGEPTEGTGYDGFEHQGSKPHGTGERDFDDVGMLDSDEFRGEELITVKAKDIRIFCINKKEQLYRLIFTPTINSSKGYIAITKLAEQNEKMPAEIIYVKNPDLEFTKNKIGYFEFKDDQPCKVDIKIAGEEYSTMEVKLYAYKG